MALWSCPIRRLIGTVLAALIVPAGIAAAQAVPVYYVHSGIRGSDSDQLTGFDVPILVGASDANPGTDPGAPLQSLGATGLQSKTPPFVAYVAGRFYTPDSSAFAFVKTTAPGVEIHQWPGQTPAQIKMSNQIGLGWTELGGGVYTKTCDASPDLRGANVSAICIDYEWSGNVDSVGRHRCFLPIQTNPAAAVAAAGTAKGGIYLDRTTGIVTLGLPAGQASPNAPHANGVEYVVAARGGIALIPTSADPPNPGIVIDGLHIGPCCGAGASPTGCGIAIFNSSGLLLANNTITDHGVHAISLGLRCLNDTTRNNTAIGMTDASNSYVWDVSGHGNQATNCKSLGDKVYANSLLACDGKSLVPAGGIGGFYVHGQVHDIEYVNCQTFEYEANDPMDRVGPADFSQEDSDLVGTTLVTPSDVNDPETYPIRWRRTNPAEFGFNQSTCFPAVGLSAYVAFINERFDGSKFGRQFAGNYIDRSAATGGLWALFGCEGVINMGAARDMAAFAVGPLARLMLVNTSFYDAAPSHTANRFALINFAGGGQVTAIGTVWGFRSSDTGAFMVSFGDAWVPAASHLFTSCEFWNVGAMSYSENAAFATGAQWASAIDIGAVVPVSDPFADNTGLTGLGLTELEQARLNLRTPHAALGVNGLAYSGNYGAYQYPDAAGCEAGVVVTPASGSFCAQSAITFTAAASGGPATAYQWIWRPSSASPWALVSEGATLGPDGRSWFHAAGAQAPACTVTYSAGDVAASYAVQLSCVMTTACSQAAADPVALRFINPPAIRSLTPQSIGVCTNQSVSFSVAVESAPGTSVSYQWQVMDPAAPGGWATLSDGPLIRNGVVVAEAHGASHPQMRYWLHAPSYGTLRVVVRNGCGSTTSSTAMVRFTSADFDGDGDAATDADIEAFFRCLGGSCCPTCLSADFNGDGDIGTDADIESFFRALAGGPC
jgi:hypothetical protein